MTECPLYCWRFPLSWDVVEIHLRFSIALVLQAADDGAQLDGIAHRATTRVARSGRAVYQIEVRNFLESH